MQNARSGFRTDESKCRKCTDPPPASQFMSKKYQVNYRQLSRETGHDRASLARWFDGRNPKNKQEALAIIDEREPKAAPDATDPASGLSWFQSSQREDTLRKRRANEEATEVQAKRWVLAEDVFAVLRTLVIRLEQWPVKIKSEAGLNETQGAIAQKLLDEIRAEVRQYILTLLPKPAIDGKEAA
jgi:hypothetical protein